jgi:predicted O-methyltransferase YrrM
LFENEGTGFAVPHDLKGKWELRLGDVRSVLPPLLSDLGQIDFFFHDSEHTYDLMSWEYAQAFAHLKPGGVISSDDVDWNAAFQDFTAGHAFSWSGIFRGRLGVAIREH